MDIAARKQCGGGGVKGHEMRQTGVTEAQLVLLFAPTSTRFLSGLDAIVILRSRNRSNNVTFSEKVRADSRRRMARLLSKIFRIHSLMNCL
jgi:hypothetical protein